MFSSPLIRRHPLPLGSPLLSRRRTRRGPARGQTTVPDWVWGAGLGAIVLIFVGGFFLFSNLGGGNSGCVLGPLPGAEAPPNTAEGFQSADTGLGELIRALRQSDFNTANALFFGPPHNFMHTALSAIREKDEDLGKRLCEAVIQFENDFDTSGVRTDPQVLAGQVTTIRDLLREGAEVLGFPRPTG